MGKKRPAEYDQSSDIASYIGGGVRYKILNKDIAQTFTAGQTYSFSLSEFGLSGISPKGFAWNTIGGNSAIDYESRPILSGSNIVYKPSASNSTHCRFQGIVFY